MCLNIGSKPPLAVFSATIVAFAVALVVVSLYLQNHKAEILNPDIKDWNSFYETLSDMDICFRNSSSYSAPVTGNQMEALPTTLGNDTINNVTFNIYADVHVEREGKTLENQIFHSYINASFLGFKRDASVLEITIELAENTAKNWTACITLSGPVHLLPNSPNLPPKCVPSKNTNKRDVELAQPWLVHDAAGWCNGGIVGGLRVAAQDELNVYLSEGDVTMIQLHILYTTCLLCVMMIGLLFYFIFGKRFGTKTKTVQTSDKIPLHP